MAKTLRSVTDARTAEELVKPYGGRSPTQIAGDDRRPATPTLVVAAGLVALGVLLRAGSTSPFWLDEALTANIAALPLPDMLDALRRDGHPPLFYLLLRFWTALVGDGDVAVRALPALFGVAAVPLVWAAGRRLGGSTCALAATVLYATSPFAIRYSTEARMYSLVAFLVVGGWLALRRAEEKPSWARLALVSLITGLLLLTHYWSLFLVTAVGAGLVWRLFPTRRDGTTTGPALRLAAALGAGGLLFVPWLPSFLAQAGSTGTPWMLPSRPAAVLVQSIEAWGGKQGSGEGVLLGLGLVALTILALLGRPVGDSRIELELKTVPAVRQEWGVTVATMGLAASVAYASQAAFAGRYTSVVHPLVILLAGSGVMVLPRQRMREVIVGGLAVVGLAMGVMNLFTDRTQAGEIAAAITADATAEDLVVYCPDQLGPGTHRLLPKELSGITFPDAGNPRFVDWVDYEAGIDAVDSRAFADAALRRAVGGNIWLVWLDDYRHLDGRCEEVADALSAQRPGRTTVTRPGEQHESAWLYRYPAP